MQQSLHKTTLLHTRNHPTSWNEVEQSIPAVFAQIVEQYPNRRAIGCGSWQPTYAELDQRSNQLANFILSQGGQPGDRIAILMNHDTPQIVALLSILKSARVAVVLSIADPEARITQTLQDTKPRLLLFDQYHQSITTKINTPHCKHFYYDRHHHHADSTTPQLEIPPCAPAYIIFTSGSTGKPKGVIQTHRNTLHSVQSYHQKLAYNDKDRILLLGLLSGGQGMMTTFTALLTGAILFPYNLRKRGIETLIPWIEKHKITIFLSATSIFRRFANQIPANKKLQHLRLVRLGAEPCTPSDLEACRRITNHHCQFANMMSASETGSLTLFTCNTNDTTNYQHIPVGFPVDNKHISIVDEHGNEVAPNEPGEMIVRSKYLSPGYWNNPSATQKAFQNIPHSDERIYRTGDIVKITPHGLIHLGRCDRQHKLMGNRVDLRAIEEVLLTHPEVTNSVVALLQQNKQLCAWITSNSPNAQNITSQLQVYLREFLPAYMIPSKIIALTSIPLTANGKPDLCELKKQLTTVATQTTVPPRTPTEQKIANIWTQTLHLTHIDVYQNFFEAGGDSLQAVDLLLRLSEELNTKISPKTLIHAPTIAQLAEAIDCGHIHQQNNLWFKSPQAHLLHLRSTGNKTPLLFIPGGNTSEGELLVFTKLIAYLNPQHPAYGARLNLTSKNVLPPWSIRQLARKIAKTWHRQHTHSIPLIFGDCQASALAYETAQYISRNTKIPPRLILLDPWRPCTTPIQENSRGITIDRYFSLLRQYEPKPYHGEVHLICAKDRERSIECHSWWESRVKNIVHLHEVPGNHQSYVREHRSDLAKILNTIIR